MERVAVFVDAGHLFAAGSALLRSSPPKRNEIALDVEAAAAYFAATALAMTQLPLLRIYWYDGALPVGLTTDQQLLAAAPNVKLRLGVVNCHGEQKGVDARIITDLVALARDRAMADAVLVGGDEDLRIGIELAQERGVRVHLLSVANANASINLRREADTVSELIASLFVQCFPFV